MGMEEKQREEQYWSDFAEKAAFPSLPEDVLAEKGAEYMKGVLADKYNPLTKALFGELLGRRFGFTDDIMTAECEGLQWVHLMIYSKRRMYARKNEMHAAFERFAFESQNPSVLSGLAIELKLRNWPMDAKAVYATDPFDKGNLLELMRRLNSYGDLYLKMRGEDRFRNLVLFWIAALLAKVRKGDAAIGRDLGDAFLAAIFNDGLDGLPETAYERRKMEIAPEKGKDYFPSTAEKLVSGLYALVKDKYGRQTTLSDDDREYIEWTIQKLRETYNRLPDEWGDFRIGTLLILLGKEDDAKTLVVPTVLKNQTQFWAWDMLGRLFPDQQKACLAKALLCPADPKMTVRVRKEALMLGLPVGDANALEDIAEPALDLLLMGNRSEKGVYDSSYQNKEGKFRVRFILESGSDVRPVSPKAVKLPRGLPYGTPVTVYLDNEDPTRIVAVRLREAELWDVVPVVNMTYYGRSQKGRAMLTFGLADLTCSFEEFPVLKEVETGTLVKVRYSTRKCDYGIAYDVKSVELTAAVSDAVFLFRGVMKLPNGIRAPGFVNGVLVPPSLVFSLADQGLAEGSIVTGRAVRLCPELKKDYRGVVRKSDRSVAITIEMLSDGI